MDKKVTGPYHTILSLDYVLKNHANMKHSVLINKEKFLKIAKNYLIYPSHYQPLYVLQLMVRSKIMMRNLYLINQESQVGFDVLCHLGETT